MMTRSLIKGKLQLKLRLHDIIMQKHVSAIYISLHCSRCFTAWILQAFLNAALDCGWIYLTPPRTRNNLPVIV